VETTAAKRGEILDAEDEPTTKDRTVQKIGFDKAQLVDDLSADGNGPTDSEIDEALTDSVTDLAELLEVDTETFVDRTLNAGEEAWVEFIVLRDDDETEIPLNEIGDIPGAVAYEDTMVLGPSRTFADSLLGTFGGPTAEQVEDADGELTAGEATGLSG